ncbi:hypothetical protein OHS70_34325 [Streptomyces sp. NBC_00390]|uniref:hypothetical protein n=1 Tax=Streptomyces sp. NBC_00390 TaxID=2975736 RepID=UPI002E1A9F16
MGYLPKLRRRRGGCAVLDGGEQAHSLLRELADLYYEDSEGVGDMLTTIAELDKAAERERHLDGLGDSEHARDNLVNQLLDEIGGAELHFDPHVTHHALMQARKVAHEARTLAIALEARAEELTRLAVIARGERAVESGHPVTRPALP